MVGMPNRHVVMSLHGIRTRGTWQKELAPELSRHGWVTAPLDYGFFGAIGLLLPWARRKRVDWLRDEYSRSCTQLGCSRPSIIAHSFGTYLVARSIEVYELQFDRIIFCGSIVRRDFPWSEVFSRDLVRHVLNDYGRLDVWARIAEWVVQDAGQSGLEGFKDNAGGRVVQREHAAFRHSDYFYLKNYQDNWVPFLRGETPPAQLVLSRGGANWRFRLSLSMLLLAAAFLLFWWFGALVAAPLCGLALFLMTSALRAGWRARGLAWPSLLGLSSLTMAATLLLWGLSKEKSPTPPEQAEYMHRTRELTVGMNLLEEKVTKLSELLQATSAELAALKAKSSSPENLTRVLENQATMSARIADASDEDVNRIFDDPSLSVDDKITLTMMLAMNKLDQDITVQANSIKGLQDDQANSPRLKETSASIDAETMKLKRLIDKRSEMFDALKQIIDRYNATANAIIDSIGR
jgi:hypothetical protein